MSDEQINLAIARELGWHSIHTSPIGIKGMKGPLRGFMPIPNYCTDLNAMHEAEKLLTDEQCVFVRDYLRERLENYPASRYIWHATARQRAEAFLRALSKWKEAQP